MSVLDQAREALVIESEAIARMAERLDDQFEAAVRLLYDCAGRAVTCGVGKSGAIARKVASTLASTGTPALYLQPVEALHGDLGMITQQDVVIMLSNSGESREVLELVPLIKRRGCALIALTGRCDSTLSREADVVLDTGVEREACALNLAPTASTACQLAMGDALAVTLMRARGFTKDDWLTFHPAGALGRRLLLRVRDLMHGAQANPPISHQATVREALDYMTRGVRRGMVNVVDEQGRLVGFFTDGDLRTKLLQAPPNSDLGGQPIAEVMTRNPTTVPENLLAAEALKLLEDKQYDNFPVVDAEGRAVGVIDVQDLIRAGII